MAAPVLHRFPLRVSDQQVGSSVRGARRHVGNGAGHHRAHHGSWHTHATAASRVRSIAGPHQLTEEIGLLADWRSP